jgi:hypothetical protein
VFGGAATVGLSTVLLAASAAKITASTDFQITLRSLRLPAPIIRPLASAVMTIELSAAVSLLAYPGAIWPRLLVLALASAFALAGLVAGRSGLRVPCNCFGSLGASKALGWRQVVAFPVWLAGLGAVQASPPTWSAESGLAVLGMIALGVALATLARVYGTWARMRGDRVAIGWQS